MNPRRGFLALVGGTMFTGAVLRHPTAAAPALVLPAGLVPAGRPRPLLDAAHAGGESRLEVILSIAQRMPKPAFFDWLEDGLQRSMLFNPPDLAARERQIEAAVAEHGSIFEAVRAGAL